MRKPRRLRRDGFALVLTIWAVGLLALLIQTFLTSARFRLHVGANIAAATRAEALADAGVALALLDLVSRSSGDASAPRFTSSPSFCVAPGGLIAVSIESESGKIDLNVASPDLLRRLLVGVGASPSEALNVTEALVDFRTDGVSSLERNYRLDGRPFGPRKGPLQAVQELDQVLGVSPSLYAAIKPHVTVYGAGVALDPNLATPRLRALLGVEARAALSSGFGAAYTIHVEALTNDGGRVARETVIGPGTLGRSLWRVREWRRDRSRWDSLFAGKKSTALMPC